MEGNHSHWFELRLVGDVHAVASRARLGHVGRFHSSALWSAPRTNLKRLWTPPARVNTSTVSFDLLETLKLSLVLSKPGSGAAWTLNSSTISSLLCRDTIITNCDLF